MSQNLTEYQVTYACKEWLLTNQWDVIAYNPPGSQGTFTIPNPGKSGSFRGQSGSESPDIVAVRGNYVLVVEAKPKKDSSDIQKLRALMDDSAKMDIFDELVRKVCIANEIAVPDNLEFLWATATPDTPSGESWLGHIQVEVVNPMDVSHLPAEKNYYSYFECRASDAPDWKESASFSKY